MYLVAKKVMIIHNNCRIFLCKDHNYYFINSMNKLLPSGLALTIGLTVGVGGEHNDDSLVHSYPMSPYCAEVVEEYFGLDLPTVLAINRQLTMKEDPIIRREIDRGYTDAEVARYPLLEDYIENNVKKIDDFVLAQSGITFELSSDDPTWRIDPEATERHLKVALTMENKDDAYQNRANICLRDELFEWSQYYGRKVPVTVIGSGKERIVRGRVVPKDEDRVQAVALESEQLGLVIMALDEPYTSEMSSAVAHELIHWTQDRSYAPSEPKFREEIADEIGGRVLYLVENTGDPILFQTSS